MPSVDQLLYCLNSSYYRFRYRWDENKKIKDSRRQNIINSYVLTSKQESEIDRYFLENYGKKVRYDWHRLYSAFTGHFDVTYIPDSIFLPELETKLVNYKYEKALSDKNILPLLVGNIPGARTANILISCVDGIYRDGQMRLINRQSAIELLKNAGEVFLKPTTDSNSGKNCEILYLSEGNDQLSGNPINILVDRMGGNFNIQEKLINHASISSLHPSSLNTFRVTTYIWDDQVFHFPLVLKVGRGGRHLDNAHQGGIFVSVDELGFLGDHAFSEYGESFTRHPDSGIQFAGYQISQVPHIIKAAHIAQERIPQVRMISWDLAIDESGALVFVEANIKAQSIWHSQICNGKGAFGTNTEDILRWIGEGKHTR